MLDRCFKKIAVALALVIASAFPAFAVDYSVTAASVVPTATTTIKHGTAGAAVTAGQIVYLDANSLYQLAKANAAGTSGTASGFGIALGNASANQPLSVAIGGHVTFNAAFTKAVTVYMSQANAGGLAPVADITSGNYNFVVGVPTTTTDLLLVLANCNCTL